MTRIVLALLALVAFAAPAHAATTSEELDTLALQLMQNKTPNITLDKRLLTLLREPAKTLEARTLPTTAAQYTANVETAMKLRPVKWIVSVREGNGLIPLPPEMGGYPTACSAGITDNIRPGWVPADGEIWSYGVGNCPSVLSAAIAKAWAVKLRRVGR